MVALFYALTYIIGRLTSNEELAMFKPNFNNNEMEHLATISMFFGGFGIFLISLGIFWFVDVYKKAHTPKDKE